MLHSVKWVSVAACTMTVVFAGCAAGGGFARRQTSQTASDRPKLEYRTAANLSPARREATPAVNEETATRPTANASVRPKRPQLNCPVDAKRLGVESAPIVTVVNGEPIFVCSHACEKKVHQDPDKYLARVRAEVAATDNARPTPSRD